MPHGQSPQRVLARSAGFAGPEAPQPLPGVAEHEFDEGSGQCRIGRATQHADGIDADRGPTQRGDETDARGAVGLAHVFFGGPAVEVDAHACGGVAAHHVERDLGGEIGEVTCIGADSQDEAQPRIPAFRHALGFDLFRGQFGGGRGF